MHKAKWIESKKKKKEWEKNLSNENEIIGKEFEQRSVVKMHLIVEKFQPFQKAIS